MDFPDRWHWFCRGLPICCAGAAQKITITTGGESGAYYQFANRYAAILAKNGITLEVKTSAGSLENLARLKNDEAQIGFVQGGVVEPKELEVEDAENDTGLLSLGSVFYEPVWVFYRGDKPLTRLTELQENASRLVRRARACVCWPSKC